MNLPKPLADAVRAACPDCHEYMEGVEALYAHLLKEAPEFDVHAAERASDRPDSSWLSEKGIAFVEGARWQHAQLAAQIAALQVENERVKNETKEFVEKLTAKSLELGAKTTDVVLKAKLRRQMVELDLKAANAEITRLRGELAKKANDHKSLEGSYRATLAASLLERDRLRDALEFYTNGWVTRQTHELDPCGKPKLKTRNPIVEADGGQRAREALNAKS